MFSWLKNDFVEAVNSPNYEILVVTHMSTKKANFNQDNNLKLTGKK